MNARTDAHAQRLSSVQVSVSANVPDDDDSVAAVVAHDTAQYKWRQMLREVGVLAAMLRFLGLVFSERAVPACVLDEPAGANLLQLGKVEPQTLDPRL